ncbi:MAG: hypothetical protein ACJ749_16135 [Flavisolibacter sp.]
MKRSVLKIFKVLLMSIAAVIINRMRAVVKGMNVASTFRPFSGMSAAPALTRFYFLGMLTVVSFCAQSQFTTGGARSNFGIDADTRAGYTKYGPAAPASVDDCNEYGRYKWRQVS